MNKNKASDESGRTRKRAKVDKRKSLPEEANDESDLSDCDKFSDDEEGGIRIDDIYIPPAPPPVCSYETAGPRLIITHIVNENFKSYAGRVVVGPFDKSFSSIVGPNGSGKSNVIDSMLFVFGYRATKIRSKKVSVLIHKSERFQNVPSCKVEVHFVRIIDKDNGDYEKIPGSEFHISRTAFQNSSSFYEMNDKRVQFKEVAMTLRKHGIDLIHNRFLILQGEVEQIALMKPKAQHPHETGMLEYLEDIIGTTRFKEPIEKLQARIETLNEERQEKLNRLRLVESERDALKGPMEETVNFLKTENRISHLKNKRFQLFLHDINEAIRESEKEKLEVTESIEKLDAKLNEMQEQKGAEKSEMDALNKELQKKHKSFDEMNEINKNAEKKSTGLTEELNQLNKNRKKTADSLKSEEDKLKNLLKIPEKNQAEIANLTEEEKILNERRIEEEGAFQEIMSSLQKETKSFQEEKDKLQAEQIKLKKKYDDMRSAFEIAKSERDIYLSTEQDEKTKLEQLQTKLGEIIEVLGSRKSNLEKLRTELPQKEREFQKARDDLDSTKTRVTSITGHLRKYQSQLEEKKSSMTANRSRNRVVDFIMKLKAEGKVPGIFGRLGDLGAIDEKYDVAVSTAASQSLDFILVNSSNTIELCLQALKAGNIGRASFLALDKLEHLRRNFDVELNVRENAPRLFDLIRVQDDRVRPAFYFAVRDTIVAKDLDQATRIAYTGARFRVVTLDGELIEKTGTMSGGGNQKMRGKMGSSVSVSTDTSTAEEVSELERTVTRLEDELHEVREHERSSEEVVARCGPAIQAMRMNITKLTIEVEGLSKQEPELKDQVKVQTQRVKDCAPNPKRLKELEKQVEITEKNSKEAEDVAKTIEEKVAVVHAKIMEITQGKTKEAQKKLDDVTKLWESTRSRITQLQVAIKTSERNAKKAKERIENMKIELEEAEKRVLEIQEERETLQNDCKLSSERAAQLKREIDEKQARYDELQEERKNFMQEVNKIKAAKLKEEQKLDAIEKKLNDTKKDVPVVRSKLEKLTLHKIPVFREPDDDDVANEDGENGENSQPTTPDRLKGVDQLTEFEKFTPEQLQKIDPDEIAASLQKEEEYLKTLNPNMNTLQDYEKKTQQYIERTKELKQITERRNLCRQGYEEARKNRLQEFMNSFNIISNKLKELYQMLTMGGDAELDLNDSLDPFTEGINFCVRPPKKSWKNITNLSGGEKTLSSLALVFALHYYRPTPLYVMDEIDAALDFKNVSIVGYYIKERTKNAQFIVISLRTNMFELANMLTGIYKTYNCTKTVTIRPDDFCQKSGIVRSQQSASGPTQQQQQQQPQPLSKTNQNEERRRKVSKHHQSLIMEKQLNRSLESCGLESDKENENASGHHYESIDDDSNDSEIIRQAESVGL